MAHAGARLGAVMARANGRWRVRGVCVQGWSHMKDGVECQDAFRFAPDDAAERVVLAVADGAGSRRRSAEGAALATGLAASAFQEALRRDGAPRDADAWHRFLAREYRRLVATFCA